MNNLSAIRSPKSLTGYQKTMVLLVALFLLTGAYDVWDAIYGRISGYIPGIYPLVFFIFMVMVRIAKPHFEKECRVVREYTITPDDE